MMRDSETFITWVGLGYNFRKAKVSSGLDDLSFALAKSDIIQTGQALIFHDDEERFYIPASTEEINEYGERHPQDLKFQLACFCKGRFAFHQRG